MSVLFLIEAAELTREAMLGFHGDCHYLGRLSLPASVKDEICCGTMPVVPGGLDQDPSRM